MPHFRTLLPLLALCLACNGPEPRTAPTADDGSSASKQSSDSNDPQRAEIVAESDLPSPSGELLSKATDCTVRLHGEGFQGSGVIIHCELLGQDAGTHAGQQRIYILTVAHAAKLGVPRVVLFSLLKYPEPLKTIEDVELVSTEDRADLALLRAHVSSDFDITVAPLAELSTPKFAFSAGCVGANPPKIISEQILRAENISVRIRGPIEKRFMWETPRPQERGRSGGPLLNDKGSLLGIALGKSGSYGYYAHLREISKYLIDNGLEGLVTCADLLSFQQDTM